MTFNWIWRQGNDNNIGDAVIGDSEDLYSKTRMELGLKIKEGEMLPT